MRKTQTNSNNAQNNSNQNKPSSKSPTEDIFGEDFQFEIETSRKNTESKAGNNPPNPNSTYIERLEAKIQSQAVRLSELENYKYLAEKRVKQLSPQELFPLTEASIKSKRNSKTNVEGKLESLQLKYNKLLKDYNDLVNNQRTSEENNGSGDNRNIITGQSQYSLEDKEQIIEQLRQETLKVEEQKNIISILKQTLDSEFIKAGLLTKNMTHENIIDFAQIKGESETYRKQLVLSQALVNSLKSEIEDLAKEKDKAERVNEELNDKMMSTERELNNKVSKYQAELSSMKKELELVNYKQIEDVTSNDSRYIYSSKRDKEKEKERERESNADTVNTILDLKTKRDEVIGQYNQLNHEHQGVLSKMIQLKNENNKLRQSNNNSFINQNDKEIIEELTKENTKLHNLIEEAEKKLSDNYFMNKNINNKMHSLEAEIITKNNHLKDIDLMEDKISNINQYIREIKIVLSSLYNSTMNSIHQCHNVSIDDNGAISTRGFAQSMKSLLTQLNLINSINPQSLDSNDSSLIKLVTSLLKLLSDEFHSLFIKLQSTLHHQDSNQSLLKEIEALSLKHEQYKTKYQQAKKDCDSKEAQLKEVNAYSIVINNKLAFVTNEKDRLRTLIQIISKCVNSKEIQELINEYTAVSDVISKLMTDKMKLEDKLQSMEYEYEKMNQEATLEGISTEEMGNIVNKEQTTLKELIYDLQTRINERELRLNDIKNALRALQYNHNHNHNQQQQQMTIEANTIRTKGMTIESAVSSGSGMYNTINHDPIHKDDSLSQLSDYSTSIRLGSFNQRLKDNTKLNLFYTYEMSN